LGYELQVEDKVGFGGDDRGTAGFAVCKLVRDEEATFAPYVHALETGVPAGNDAVAAVGEGDGFFAGVVEGGVKLRTVREPARVVDGVVLAVFGEGAGSDFDVDVLDGVERLGDADNLGDVWRGGGGLRSGGGVVGGGGGFRGGGRLGGGGGGEGGQEGNRGELCSHYGSSLTRPCFLIVALAEVYGLASTNSHEILDLFSLMVDWFAC
jgi:hypothetical protein